MTSQTFALRLNMLLDRFHFPKSSEDREVTFSEYFHMPQTKAKMILTGMFLPRLSIIEKIAEDLFIDTVELTG